MPSAKEAREAREARRRKILAQGSDRLAFITGERSSIPSSTLPSPLATTSFGSGPPSPTSTRPGDAALIRFLDATPSVQPSGSQQSAGADLDDKANTKVIKDVHQQLRATSEVQDFPEVEAVANWNLGSSHTKEGGRSADLDQKVDQPRIGFTKGVHLGGILVTWDGIGHSIDVTQNYRALGALSLALLLVAQSFLFCIDEGENFSNWVLPWPVAVVIMTDISLVFGALLLGFVRTSHLIGDADINDVSPFQDQLSQVLQMSSKLECVLAIWALFSKTFRALFLDCSIYVVVLTSGYSLVQNWQSAFCGYLVSDG